MSSAPAVDAALFDAVYREHHRVIYAYLVGQCGDAESAADLMQETFLRVWRHMAEVRQVPAGRRRFYVFAIARNILLDERRRPAARQRHADAARLEEAARHQAQAADPANAVLARDTAAAVDHAIRQLPPELRTVLSLHLMTQMNSMEISRALDMPASTVRYRLSQARQCIRERLGTGHER
jgi:RNA polymerase sigma-70 factor (ECF subfamily)